ncbi:MAG: F0F1 ATP synthase subunit A [Eubacterium sp.]|nr:F0F1 ATP synthase subunit A [Eubacterium sp.]
MEELNCETVFTIPIFGGIGISEAVVVTWIVMAILVALAIPLGRNLTITNCSRKQLLLEAFFGWLDDFFTGLVGENGRCYVPYLMTVIIYIGFANVIGIFGMKSPTKDVRITAALAIMSIILVQVAGIRARGVKGWLKSFAEPVFIVAPINVLELVIKPLSLCMRLFGNVLGAYIIMEMIELVVPVIIPTIFSLYFDFFDGFIQAYVFCFLTALYIRESIGDE